ncbi:MAG: electron transport complex subunit RsxC [Clostridia bacterium]|nr:electron transport complex subunit RsxC [Clostridia bacterium]
MKDTFRGGVHPAEHKELSRDAALVRFDPKGEMVFPLSQHIGKPAKPVVQKGDSVLVGQMLAQADGFVSAHVFSSCSGTVKAVEPRRTLMGTFAECVVVDNDGQFTPFADFETRQDTYGVSAAEVVKRVQDAGIVGLGGAGFPTHVKLAPKNPDAIRYVIANGAECEPYLTCNDQLMRSQAHAIAEGLELMLRLFPNAEGVICIERNKPEAIQAMREAIQGKTRMSVRDLRVKYPQGGERSLISVIAGVDFPTSKLPADVGCIVENVGTIYAIQRAVYYGEPLFSHCLTLSGEGAANPGNYIVRDGTMFSELLEHAGGIKEGAMVKKAMVGGPMMGIALASLDVPVQKQNNGLTLLVDDENEQAEKDMTACLHCGRCTTVCPQGLLPQMMADAVHVNDMDRYENKLHGLECIQCGSCSYICPARQPLTQIFKRTKAEILARKRAQSGR